MMQAFVPFKQHRCTDQCSPSGMFTLKSIAIAILLLFTVSDMSPVASAASVKHLTRNEWTLINPDLPLIADDNVNALVEYRMNKLRERPADGYTPSQLHTRWQLRGDEQRVRDRLTDEYRRKLNAQNKDLRHMKKPYTQGLSVGANLPAPYYQLLARQYERSLMAENPLDIDGMQAYMRRSHRTDEEYGILISKIRNFLAIPVGQEADKGRLDVEPEIFKRLLTLDTFWDGIWRWGGYHLLEATPDLFRMIINDPRAQFTPDDLHRLAEFPYGDFIEILSKHPLFNWSDTLLLDQPVKLFTLRGYPEGIS